MPWMPGAVARPVPSHSGLMVAHNGLVLHVQVGDGSCYGEFSVPANQASSTWWVAKSGLIEQYVDSDYAAWTEAAGNSTWDSVETEGFPTEPLTPAQITSLSQIYIWGRQQYGWPLALTDDPNGRGFGWHGMGGVAWGNHPNCPGDIRKGQRSAVLLLAGAAPAPTPTPTPTPNGATDMFTAQPDGKGYRIVKPDGSVWGYGTASYHGGLNPGAPVGGGAMPAGITAISITTTPTGAGYWILSSNYSVYAFGDAVYLGHP